MLIADFFCCKNKEGGGATEEVGATGAGSIAEHAHECSDGGDIHEKNEVDGDQSRNGRGTEARRPRKIRHEESPSVSVKLERLPARPLRARDDRFRGALTLTSLRSVSLSRDARFPNPRR